MSRYSDMTPAQVADALHEYQLWRKGAGKYDWNPDFDMKGPEPMPYTPKELTAIEDRAIEILRGLV